VLVVLVLIGFLAFRSFTGSSHRDETGAPEGLWVADVWIDNSSADTGGGRYPRIGGKVVNSSGKTSRFVALDMTVYVAGGSVIADRTASMSNLAVGETWRLNEPTERGAITVKVKKVTAF
jgi:hypothetical protein